MEGEGGGGEGGAGVTHTYPRWDYLTEHSKIFSRTRFKREYNNTRIEDIFTATVCFFIRLLTVAQFQICEFFSSFRRHGDTTWECPAQVMHVLVLVWKLFGSSV